MIYFILIKFVYDQLIFTLPSDPIPYRCCWIGVPFASKHCYNLLILWHLLFRQD